ncbi:MAG: hypothetical protein E6H57_12655 [Betaproteobacteria bacterium]|nr:MAG: hypothetical protein E6H57_12655 [Betaproteobacteria bacterium]
MNRFVVALLIGLASTAHSQDAVQTVLQAAPQLVGFAGSPENFYNLVVGLTEGTPARLAGPAAGGFSRVTTINAPARLGAAEAAAVLERARQNLEFLGIVQPTPEQLSAALAGGVLVTPTGSTQVRGVLPQAARAEVRSQLEPDLRTPTVDERAFAQLPLELQSLLGGMPPREALLKVQLAQQHLIALGNAYGSSERLRAMVQNVLAPPSGGYTVASFSAGTTSFPPMSPLVSPYLPATR